jgi:hypothetical protein
MVKTEQNIRHYELIEIKYCRDTASTQQENRGERQHDRLMKSIAIFDPRAEVKFTTIMLGVSGCIYKKTEQKLKGLAIQGTALSSFNTWQVNMWRSYGRRGTQP